jgi:hypothetical protein
VTFSIFSCFLHLQPSVFQTPDKVVILSEALRRFISNRRLYGAQSKDPGDDRWQMLLGAFRPRTSKRTRISCFTALTDDHVCGSPGQNHMQLTEAKIFDGKSGEADLQFRGPFLEMFLQQSVSVCDHCSISNTQPRFRTRALDLN